jgi:type III pantothenate kinase
MILLIDAGNTNVTIGFYENSIKEILRLKTRLDGAALVDEVKDFIAQQRLEKPHHAIMCSVVPKLTGSLAEALKESFDFEPLIVNHGLKLGIKLCIKIPEELGADRIANAVAAHRLYRGHVIIADFGTATTLSFVSSEGEYRGGTIMPGLGISGDTLADRTSQLPRVELRKPPQVLDGTTEGNILSGLILGHAGAVERIIRDIKKELDAEKVIQSQPFVKVIATGGFAPFMVPFIDGIDEIKPSLTLEGLRFIYELNGSM